MEFKKSTTALSEFEQLYLAVRDKEGRVYSDEQVALLPYLKKGEAHFQEWQVRAKTAKRFLAYLNKYHSQNSLLEIGCGNGWFSNQCAGKVAKVLGIDVNRQELEQASRVFMQTNLDFKYWDLFQSEALVQHFDCIVLNAVVQYFPDIKALLNRLKELLNPKGEIHILDSPFYEESEIQAARKRTIDYYTSMGVPEMGNYYFHHPKSSLSDFETLFNPPNKLQQFLLGKEAPFSWYRLKI